MGCCHSGSFLWCVMICYFLLTQSAQSQTAARWDLTGTDLVPGISAFLDLDRIVLGLLLWSRGFQCWNSILEHQFKAQSLYFWSSFLLMHLERQWTMAQVLGPLQLKWETGPICLLSWFYLKNKVFFLINSWKRQTARLTTPILFVPQISTVARASWGRS